jgi:hypothetical protein
MVVPTPGRGWSKWGKVLAAVQRDNRLLARVLVKWVYLLFT